LENEGGYRWFDLILHFAKARYNRANRHPDDKPQPSYLSQMVLGQKLMKQILRQIQPEKGK